MEKMFNKYLNSLADFDFKLQYELFSHHAKSLIGDLNAYIQLKNDVFAGHALALKSSMPCRPFLSEKNYGMLVNIITEHDLVNHRFAIDIYLEASNNGLEYEILLDAYSVSRHHWLASFIRPKSTMIYTVLNSPALEQALEDYRAAVSLRGRHLAGGIYAVEYADAAVNFILTQHQLVLYSESKLAINKIAALFMPQLRSFCSGEHKGQCNLADLYRLLFVDDVLS